MNIKAIDQFLGGKGRWVWKNRSVLIPFAVATCFVAPYLGAPNKSPTAPVHTVEQLQERKAQNAISKARIQCEIMIQGLLKDPDSYKRHAAPQWNNEILVYSATNSFGGRIRKSFDCGPIVDAAVKRVAL